MQEETIYDVLKTRKSNNGISLVLSNKWLDKNLGVQDGDFVFQQTSEIGGKKVVVLTRFDPKVQMVEQFGATNILQEENSEAKGLEEAGEIGATEGSNPEEKHSELPEN